MMSNWPTRERLLLLSGTQDTHSDKTEKERGRYDNENQRRATNVPFAFGIIHF
jgi:hypothetical protein